MDVALLRADIVPQLWLEYKKTPDFKHGAKKAIPPHHPVVEKREREGLKMIYSGFVNSLRQRGANIVVQFRQRTIGEWIKEWKDMHSTLFKYVYKKRGDWRKVDVRFGTPGDEDLYRIPKYQEVPREITLFADELERLLNIDYSRDEDKIKTLAKVHYQFIRIHPFSDGNGRIARAITDQLAFSFDFPVAMVGYPRHSHDKREEYHKAIRSCVEDSECLNLARWIGSYIEEVEKLA